jgi:cAMP-specific phosphodiesterase 4
VRLFEAFELFARFDIPRANFVRFVTSLEAGYRDANPYHNATRAALVVHAVHSILSLGLADLLDDLAVLALAVAAMILDHEHPGTTNAYEICARTPLAVLYNDSSPIENHSLSTAIEMLEDGTRCGGITSTQGPEIARNNDIFANLEPRERSRAMCLIRGLVLDSCLSRHFEIVAAFTATTPRLLQESRARAADLPLVMAVALKAADLHAAASPTPYYMRWMGERFMAELYAVGDAEASRGLEVSAFCDRAQPCVSRCQIAILDLVATPCFEALGNLLPQLQLATSRHLVLNRAAWNL